MNFQELLRRSNLDALESFLLFGADSNRKPSDQSYAERLDEARKKAIHFFEERYQDFKEYDEITGHFYEFTSVYQDVYFEIGLIAGANIAFQLRGRMEELI